MRPRWPSVFARRAFIERPGSRRVPCSGVTTGCEPGDLSLLRTLEALAIGVQGKRCLWRALQNVRTVPSTVDGMNFVALEAKAVRQREAIEERRGALVARTFCAAASRAE